MNFDRRVHRVCVITDPDLGRGLTHEQQAERALRAGVRMIELRDKTIDDDALVAVARLLRRLTTRYGALLIVNDRPDVAVESRADGAHVGQHDGDIFEVRRILGADRVLGVSVGDVDEAVAAEEDGADYLGFGPVFDSRGTKPDAGEPVGPERIRAIRAACAIPILAVGGIDPDNAADALRAGADGVAALSSVIGADDIEAAAADLVRAVDGVPAADDPS